MSLNAYTFTVEVPARAVKLHVPLIPTKSVQWRIPTDLTDKQAPILRLSATAGNGLNTNELDGWTFDDIELEEFQGFWIDNPGDDPVELVFSGSPGRQSIDRNGILQLLDVMKNGLTISEVEVSNFDDLGSVNLTVQPRPVARATSTGAILHEVSKGETMRQVVDISATPNVKSLLIQVAPMLPDGVTVAGDLALSGSNSINPVIPEVVIPAGSLYELNDEQRNLWIHNDADSYFWVTVKEYA